MVGRSGRETFDLERLQRALKRTLDNVRHERGITRLAAECRLDGGVRGRVWHALTFG